MQTPPTEPGYYFCRLKAYLWRDVDIVVQIVRMVDGRLILQTFGQTQQYEAPFEMFKDWQGPLMRG